MKKYIVITGASSPLGLEIVKKLDPVYNLILIYNQNYEPLKKYVNNHKVIKCDFQKEENIHTLIEEINKLNVNIYALINIAALTKDSSPEEINLIDFTNSYIVNVYAPLKISTSINLKGGIIINIASTDGIDTFNSYGIVYALTKSSLIYLTTILSTILKNTKVYAFAPNYIDTPIVRSMNPNFLKSEMERINQKELLTTNNVANNIIELLNSKDPSGSIYRMDGNNEYRKIN